MDDSKLRPSTAHYARTKQPSGEVVHFGNDFWPTQRSAVADIAHL
jgi:hypothetical protein